MIYLKKLNIQNILQKLGERVSVLAEENRVRLIRDDAGRHLIKLISEFISTNQWLNIYQNTDDIFIKEIMLDWGAHLFPEGFVK